MKIDDAVADVNPSAYQLCESEESLASNSNLDVVDSTRLFDLVRKRVEGSDREGYVLVQISDWLAHVADGAKGSQFMLVDVVKDVSQKARVVEGAFLVDEEWLFDPDSSMPDSVHDVLEEVDETAGDYVDDVGATFAPKSQTEGIYALKVSNRGY